MASSRQKVWPGRVYRPKSDQALFYDSAEWAEIRALVLLRDVAACRRCGTGENLSVHHVVPRDSGGSDEINNLVTLCLSCHDAVELDPSTLQIAGLHKRRSKSVPAYSPPKEPPPASPPPPISIASKRLSPPAPILKLTAEQLAQVQAKRADLQRAHDVVRSWSKLAARLGVPKSTLYAFVKRGYLPQNVRSLSKLIVNVERIEVITYTVTRDKLGRWASPKK